ncbi:MAG TPA: hypothetical protein VFY51_02740 [Pyrinomonadaceae bacterium]|nr:hypothetical protein [Pyrinomonadaceae bacterium]
MKPILILLTAVLVCAGCSGNGDDAHTTATTVVSPPPRQVLRAEFRDAPDYPFDWRVLDGKQYDKTKPILVFDIPQNATYREGEPVVIYFTVVHPPPIKGDEDKYRVRYMVDDDDMQWIEREGQVWIWGWLPGKHTIRLELVGPDGWPARNGDFNIETREITIEK